MDKVNDNKNKYFYQTTHLLMHADDMALCYVNRTADQFLIAQPSLPADSIGGGEGKRGVSCTNKFVITLSRNNLINNKFVK